MNIEKQFISNWITVQVQFKNKTMIKMKILT